MRHTGFSIIMPTYNQAAFIRRAIPVSKGKPIQNGS